jgi:hypothetical protein
VSVTKVVASPDLAVTTTAPHVVDFIAPEQTVMKQPRGLDSVGNNKYLDLAVADMRRRVSVPPDLTTAGLTPWLLLSRQ